MSSRSIDDTPKRQRTRLARAELWLQLAMVAGRWEGYAIDASRQVDELDDIARRYGLSGPDMRRACKSIADQCERRAMSGGYEEAWVFDDDE